MRTKDKKDEAATKGSLLSRLLLIFGTLLLVLALAIAGYIAWQYVDAQNRYKEIKSVAGLEITSRTVVDIDLTLEELRFDWEALRILNPDVVGWIIVPGTNINYPIVQGKDNEFYLYHLFDSSNSGTGAIFVDYLGSPTLDGQNNIIYGHNMLDGSMFSDIFLYSNQSYFDEHRVLYLCTPELNYELSAIASINLSANAPLRQFTFEEEDSFLTFVREILATPLAAAPDLYQLINEAEQLYSFVTCETFDFDRRVILSCIPIRSVVPSEL
ncbi:MAG: class B sortase [Coriobacteriia bacterium]|nr:class B sortase [Coriobacteriia bacterium]